jgi:hypothetical protein
MCDEALEAETLIIGIDHFKFVTHTESRALHRETEPRGLGCCHTRAMKPSTHRYRHELAGKLRRTNCFLSVGVCWPEVKFESKLSNYLL